jgi:hypothetical protein
MDEEVSGRSFGLRKTWASWKMPLFKRFNADGKKRLLVSICR